MIIIWGTKNVHRKQGYVADFCPICRGARPFVVYSIKQVGHLYYIPMGFGKEVGHQGRCTDCGIKLALEISEFTEIEKSKPFDITTLINRTRPMIASDYQERLSIERQIMNSNVSGMEKDSRFNLLLEPFQLVEPWFLDHYKETKIDGRTSLGCLGTLVLTLLIFVGLDLEAGSLPAKIAIVIISLGGLYTVLAALSINRRHVNTWVLPTLARSLRPLRPSLAELEEILDKLAQEVSKHYKKIDAGKLEQIIHNPNHRRVPFDARLAKDASQL